LLTRSATIPQFFQFITSTARPSPGKAAIIGSTAGGVARINNVTKTDADDRRGKRSPRYLTVLAGWAVLLIEARRKNAFSDNFGH